MRGVVNWFDRQMGFITPTGGGVDVFVHYSAIVAKEGEYRKLEGGQRVEYELGERNGRTIAVNVRKLEEENGSRRDPVQQG